VFPQDVKGWLGKKEGRLLYDLVLNSSGVGEVVELGAYQGKSTICLAQALKKIGKGSLITVDNFNGDKYTGKSDSFFNVFMDNLHKYDLEEWVTPLNSDFNDASQIFNKKIRLLFIDGSHSYEDVKKDFGAWGQKVSDGGVIIFHDALAWPGVVKFIKEVITTGKYKDINFLNDYAGMAYMIKGDKASEDFIDEKLSEYTNLVRKKRWNLMLLRIREYFK